MMMNDLFPMNIGGENVRSERTLLTGVENSCDVTIRPVGFMTSAIISISERMVRCRSIVNCWRWGLMPDHIIDALSASAMRVVWMRKANLATP